MTFESTDKHGDSRSSQPSSDRLNRGDKTTPADKTQSGHFAPHDDNEPTPTETIYGIQRRRQFVGKEISTSSTVAFTTQLSSLIESKKSQDGAYADTSVPSSSLSSSSARGRRRGAGGVKKDDILLSSHNRGVNRRAEADQIGYEEYLARQRAEAMGRSVGGGANRGKLDSDTWQRVQERMKEKARAYESMEYADPGASGRDADDDDKLIDFERKWEERLDRDDSDDGDLSTGKRRARGSDEDTQTAEYEDEFGRTRTGTKAEAAMAMHRAKRARQDKPGPGSGTNSDRDDDNNDPNSRVIRGNVIQHYAFNPSEETVKRMAELADRAERSPSPPPPVHYDANSEVRTRGQGFFQFSTDHETRKAEMAALDKERRDTVRDRSEVAERRARRQREVEERRRKLLARRREQHADGFLRELGDQLLDGQEG